MVISYLKVALRNLSRRKGYSFVIIAGLAVGMACCIFILLYVQHELTFDQYNENHDRIYRLVAERKVAKGISPDLTMPPPLTAALLNDFPQITQAVRILNIDNPIPLVSLQNTSFYEKQFLFVDSSFLNVFTIPILQGDARTALSKPNSVVISEHTARRYFGDSNPIGQSLKYNNVLSLEVTGVVRDFPSNSTQHADFLASFSTLTAWLGNDFVNSWTNNTCQVYVLLAPGATTQALIAQLPGFRDKYLGKNSGLQELKVQPLDRIHLYSLSDFGLNSGGDIFYVVLLSAVAFFVLFIASVNFANLTTARLVLRSKEVGVRKLIGARREQLIFQFLFESSLTVIIAVVLSAALVEVSLPLTRGIVGQNFGAGFIGNWKAWLAPIGIVLFIGLATGSYPALVLSALSPIQNLKASSRPALARIFSGKGMVVFQFSLTITLIIVTSVVYEQLTFVQNKQLGFDKDQVVVVPIRNEQLRQNSEVLRQRLMQNPAILQVGASALLPGGPVGRTRFRSEGVSEGGTMSMLWIDQDFIKALGLKLVAGRDFSRDRQTDASEAFIINEQAVRQLGWKNVDDAVGKPFELVNGKKGFIIGVVKNFNYLSLHNKIEPLVLQLWPWMNYLLLRVDVSNMSEAMKGLKTVWHESDPNNPLTYTFLNDNFDRSYESDKQLGTLFGSFTVFAVLIACSGLLSLAAFKSERRTKEIGIRKVLGATVASIVGLMTREYIIIVLLANLFAWPLGYFVMNKWLQDFAYRVNLGFGPFLLAGGTALFIVLLTVSYHAIKAATANPVEALRYE